MAEQIERVRIGHLGSIGQRLEVDSPLRQFINDLPPPFQIHPRIPKFFRRAPERLHFFPGILGEFHHAEPFAVCIQIPDHRSGNLNIAAIHVIFLRAFRDGRQRCPCGRRQVCRLSNVSLVMTLRRVPLRCVVSVTSSVVSPSSSILIFFTNTGSPSKSGSANSRVAAPV